MNDKADKLTGETSETHNRSIKCSILIDSLFVKQSFQEARILFPRIREEEFLLSDIVDYVLRYCDHQFCDVFYFEAIDHQLRPEIITDTLNKTIFQSNKHVTYSKIVVDFVAVEMIEYFLQKEKNFEQHFMIADDPLYGILLGGNGPHNNLTIFRRRSDNTNMSWDFYNNYGYFIDIIEHIYKAK